jgi:hypothetical protein
MLRFISRSLFSTVLRIYASFLSFLRSKSDWYLSFLYSSGLSWSKNFCRFSMSSSFLSFSSLASFAFLQSSFRIAMSALVFSLCLLASSALPIAASRSFLIVISYSWNWSRVVSYFFLF